MKDDPKSAHVPVVLLAGAFESFDANKAQEVGAADHVIKPFESSELIEKVSNVLAGAQAGGQEEEQRNGKGEVDGPYLGGVEHQEAGQCQLE